MHIFVFHKICLLFLRGSVLVHPESAPWIHHRVHYFKVYPFMSSFRKISLNRTKLKNSTGWKVSVFRIFLVRIQSECGKIQTRKTPNMETFYAVSGYEAKTFEKFLWMIELAAIYLLRLKGYFLVDPKSAFS